MWRLFWSGVALSKVFQCHDYKLHMYLKLEVDNVKWSFFCATVCSFFVSEKFIFVFNCLSGFNSSTRTWPVHLSSLLYMALPLDGNLFHSVCYNIVQILYCCFLSLLHTVLQQDPGCWRSRVCAMPCCSIFLCIRTFFFQPQLRTRWPPPSPPPHPLLLLFLLFHTLRWTIFFPPLTEIVIEFYDLSFTYCSNWNHCNTYQETIWTISHSCQSLNHVVKP